MAVPCGDRVDFLVCIIAMVQHRGCVRCDTAGRAQGRQLVRVERCLMCGQGSSPCSPFPKPLEPPVVKPLLAAPGEESKAVEQEAPKAGAQQPSNRHHQNSGLAGYPHTPGGAWVAAMARRTASGAFQQSCLF